MLSILLTVLAADPQLLLLLTVLQSQTKDYISIVVSCFLVGSFLDRPGQTLELTAWAPCMQLSAMPSVSVLASGIHETRWYGTVNCGCTGGVMHARAGCCETDNLHTAPLSCCACTGTCSDLRASCAPQVSACMTYMPAKQASELLICF